MKEFNVKFKSAQAITTFVGQVKEQIDGNVDAKCGRYIVDAKSILGMLSLSSDKMVISMDDYTASEIAVLERICDEYKAEV